MLPWHTQSSHHAPSPPARFADEQRSPPAGTFPYTPSMVLCSVQIPDPARSRHGGCISPWPPRIHPPANPPRVLPSEGARARVPGLGGAELRPGRPRPLAWLRPLPPSPLPGAGTPEPPGCAAATGQRSLPVVPEPAGAPEPPAGTGGAELPACGAARRYRSRRYRPTEVPWLPGPRSVPPLSSAPPRPVPLSPAPPGRRRGARPGGLRAPRPAAGD